jgi:hypothetical protein
MSDLEIAARFAYGALATWPMKDDRDRAMRNDLIAALQRGLNYPPTFDQTTREMAWRRACAVAGQPVPHSIGGTDGPEA